MSSFEFLTVTDHPVPGLPEAQVRVLTLAREAKKNAISVGLSSDLAQAVREADQDARVRAVVVTALGSVFSAGVDLSLFLGQAPDIGARPPESVTTPDILYQALAGCQKPLVALVQGQAVGMGVTLLPYFDLVYASDQATFACPFVKLGLVLEFGSSFSLPRLIGRQRTNELMLRAAPLDAATAERWGLVTRVFPHAELASRALELVLEIAANPPSAVAESKRLIREGEQATHWQGCVDAENAALQSRYGSPENLEAVTAFFSRRSR
ncbi:MAG: enoyl-CoA hydratase/isomerase family protein [Polyangiaceae bacterium]|nr:enoyl-CoA hydratase/isomerase family protein [Polyangiaceae bacterium]MCW5791792.1 enoyl-CoA hydratase/isomerase family protein [Polyangiaceae bacterium]